MRAIRFSWKMIVNVVVMLMCSNCLSPVSLDIESIGGRLIISGQLSTLADRTLVQVGRTAPGQARLPMPISNAFVTGADDQGEVLQLAEDPSKPGNYTLSTAAKVGRSYRLNVQTPTGEFYESTLQPVPAVSFQDEITTKFERETFTDLEGTVTALNFLYIYATTKLPESEQPHYIKWDTESVYVLVPTDFPDIFGNIPPSCYITENSDPQRIAIFNGNEVRTNLIENKLIVKRLLDQSFHTRHYFTIYNTSLNRDAYEYWRKVNILANQVGSVFDAPPAEITGNISRPGNVDEKVLGYFQVVNQTFKRIYFVADDLPYKLPEYCEFSYSRNYNSYPPYCLNCIDAPNSSYLAPSWF